MDNDQANSGNDDFFHPTRDVVREATANYSSPLLDNGSNDSNSKSRSLLEVVHASRNLAIEPTQVGNRGHERSQVGIARAVEGAVTIDSAKKHNPKKMIRAAMDTTMVTPTEPVTNAKTATVIEAPKKKNRKEKVVIPTKNKKQRAKPGFGLRSSRTTIVETGQKRRSCICTNSKKCNELMTKWAKVSPPDYHFVLLPKEHTPPTLTGLLSIDTAIQHDTGIDMGKTETVDNTASTTPSQMILATNSDTPHNESTSMSSTDIYKNGFRYATLRHISGKNPLPKDERIALCHYHPEVRPYLFWPKNTPSAQKYAIPLTLAIQLGYDVEAAKCQGLNTEKYCYALPIYPFEAAKEEIGNIEKDFHDRVQQIQTNPAQFVRDLRQLEEEIQEVHKLRKRNMDLLRKLDDRRRSIKRLRSVLKVQQRHNATNEVQQQQQVQQSFAVGQVTNDPTEVGASGSTNGGHQQHQFQQHSYSTGTGTIYHHQQQHQQLVDPSQHQPQAAPVPQPLVLQTQNIQQHNHFFQTAPTVGEQQAIGIVLDGISQNNQQQQQQDSQQHDRQHQHHQQPNDHHWAFNQQYQSNPVSGPSSSENGQQQQPQQHLRPAPMQHAFDSTPNHHSQQDQNHPHSVTAPLEETNNPGNGFSSYAHQLEAAMAAAVAVGFKDDQEGLVGTVEDDHQHAHPHLHQHPHTQQSNHHSHPPPDNIAVGDVAHVDDLDDYNDHPNLDSGFGADPSDDEDLRDDDCSDTERYRQSLGGPFAQSIQRPRKWPRRTVILRPVAGSKRVENETKTSTNHNSLKRTGINNCDNNPSGTKGGGEKKSKISKSVATKDVS